MASAGTTALLIASSLLLLLVVSALVAFRGWPGADPLEGMDSISIGGGDRAAEVTSSIRSAPAGDSSARRGDAAAGVARGVVLAGGGAPLGGVTLRSGPPLTGLRVVPGPGGPALEPPAPGIVEQVGSPPGSVVVGGPGATGDVVDTIGDIDPGTGELVDDIVGGLPQPPPEVVIQLPGTGGSLPPLVDLPDTPPPPGGGLPAPPQPPGGLPSPPTPEPPGLPTPPGSGPALP